MERRIAVLGAGAIGSSVGADLTKAGYDVTLVDQWLRIAQGAIGVA